MGAYDFAEQLMHLDWEVWDENGFRSRPTGEDRRIYLNACLGKLEQAGIDPADVTAEVVDILEDENYHSLNDVLDVYLGRATIEALMEREYQYYA